MRTRDQDITVRGAVELAVYVVLLLAVLYWGLE